MEGVSLEVAAERWSLELGDPFAQGAAGFTTRATLPDGTPVVLKLADPHHESEHEADALELWGGDGAIRSSTATNVAACCSSSAASPARRSAKSTPTSRSMSSSGSCRGSGYRLRPPFHTLADEAAWWAEYQPRP